MNTGTRVTILATSLALCAGGGFTAGLWMHRNPITSSSYATMDLFAVDSGYQLASASALSFQELESIIRRDPVAKKQRGKVEFGSMRTEQGMIVAQVVFVAPDGRAETFLYKLSPDRDSWKIVNVQRLWFVPRSRLLRGVRA